MCRGADLSEKGVFRMQKVIVFELKPPTPVPRRYFAPPAYHYYLFPKLKVFLKIGFFLYFAVRATLWKKKISAGKAMNDLYEAREKSIFPRL